MVAHVSAAPVNLLNPFICAKLDVQSVYAHEFAKIPRSENKYALARDGKPGIAFLEEQEKAIVAGIAKSRLTETVDE